MVRWPARTLTAERLKATAFPDMTSTGGAPAQPITSMVPDETNGTLELIKGGARTDA